MARRGICIGVALAVSLSACVDTKTAPRPPLFVKTQQVQPEDHVDSLELSGEIQARAQSDVSFRVSGRVIERDADVGQHVEAGALLAKIDPAEPQADLDAANAAVTSAEALLKQATSAYDRQKALFDTGFATRSVYDTAQQNLRTAQSALDQAKAQAASAKDALSYSELRAERAGVITARNIEVGQVAQAAQAAFTLAQDGPRDAVFNVFESIFFLKPASDGIQISLISDPSVRVMGHVREIAPAVDARTGTVRVKVGIEEGAAEMPLGAAVTGKGAFAPQKVFVLPWSAAATRDGALAVWVVDPASKTASPRVVVAEAFEREKLFIQSGLKPGEIVVTEGGKFLYPGAPVDIAEARP